MSKSAEEVFQKVLDLFLCFPFHSNFHVQIKNLNGIFAETLAGKSSLSKKFKANNI
jgi:hypothetical protein